MAELRGILAEADQGTAEQIAELPLLARVGVWWWRFRRRFRRDAGYIGTLVLGCAIGAGLGIGLLRALLAIVVEDMAGVLFYNYFPMGFLLGGALALGLLLHRTILLLQWEGRSGKREENRIPIKLTLGAISFAVMHLLLRWLFNGEFFTLLLNGKLFEGEWFIFLMALFAGLVLSICVHDRILPGTRWGFWQWSWRLGVIIPSFGIIQYGFIMMRNFGVSLLFVWNGFSYRLMLYDPLDGSRLENILLVDNWFHYISIIDSILAGIFIAVGFILGLVTANNLYQKYHVTGK